MSMIKTHEDGPVWEKIGHAIRYLTANYESQPSLAAAAKEAGMSETHFQKVFTRYAGVSPKDFVAHLTLERAQGSLSKGASVLKAALDAGLSGPSRLHDLSLKIEAMTPGEFARKGEGLTIRYGFHPSPFGSMLVMLTERGLCGLAFMRAGEDEVQTLEDMTRRWPKAKYREDEKATGRIADLIVSNKGELTLHLMGTPWQIQVWRALLAIPSGKVTTYQTVANKVRAAKASRAVGAAVGRNPISLLIPCHRVLASDGKLTGYHWGVERKRAMLALESARASQSAKSSQSESPENIRDGVKAGLLALAPFRRRHRAAREDAAVLGDMGQYDAFARSGQDHVMLADHRAAAQRSKSDHAVETCASLAMACPLRLFVERRATAFGGRLPKQKRGA
jgi:AraC family transcriptional regulator of adaptative response/methylated-DNA-[protein]-cysteine methyltransferase